LTDPSAALREAEAKIGAALSDDVLNRALEKRAETYLASLRLEVSKALAPLLVEPERSAMEDWKQWARFVLGDAPSPDPQLSVREMRALICERWDARIAELTQRAEAAERLVAEPREPGRCATCRHNMDRRDGCSLEGQYRTACAHPLAIAANKGGAMITPWPFGCTLYQPVPSPASEAP